MHLSTTFAIFALLSALCAATAIPQLEEERRCPGGVIVCQKGSGNEIYRCWKNCSLRQCYCPDDANHRSCDIATTKDDFCGDCKDGWNKVHFKQGPNGQEPTCGS